MAADQLAGETSSLKHDAASEQRQRYIAPSPTALIFVLLVLVVPLLLQKPLLKSDGDVARHLAHGRYMLEHGTLIRTDPFSFTRPGAPFLGFEYGSQLLYGLAERVGGLPAVAILAGLLIALTYALLTRFLLRRGVDPLLACLIVAIAVALGVEHWIARPHLFSFLGVIILLGLLERPPQKPVLHFGVLFGVWANLHGGFVYGWILIALYLMGSLAELVWTGPDVTWRRSVRYYLVALVAAMVVTLLNPHGLDLLRHVVEFFNKPFMLDNTAEFASPDFHEPSGRVFLAVLLLTFASLTLHPRRPTLPHLLLICAGAAFALGSVRNISLFGLTALPVLAFYLDEPWRRLPDPGGMRSRFGVTSGRTTTLPWIIGVAALLCTLGLGQGRIGSLQTIQNHFDPTIFPVDAVAQARRAQLRGRLFHEFTWGGYLIYAWPEQKIFIDGGVDFFGDDLFREYRMIKQMEPGWRNRLSQRDISLALLRRESALAHEMVRDGNWDLWYCDSLTVLLNLSPAVSVRTRAAADSAEQRLATCTSTLPVRPSSVPRPTRLGTYRVLAAGAVSLGIGSSKHEVEHWQVHRCQHYWPDLGGNGCKVREVEAGTQGAHSQPGTDHEDTHLDRISRNEG